MMNGFENTGDNEKQYDKCDLKINYNQQFFLKI